MKPIKLLASFFTVGLWTLLSRVLGFARDILIAAYLGSGPIAEAFLIAFSLPNLFRRFFAEGAFNMAFIPLFSKKLEKGDDPEKFAQDAFLALSFILAALTILGLVIMPALVSLMAYGFHDGQKFELTVYYGRIAFPYIFFISLSALCSGVLNASGRFSAAAAAPALLNVVLIGAILWGLWGCQSCEALSVQNKIGGAMIFAVPLAGVAQLALVWRAMHRLGYVIRPQRPSLTPDLKRLLVIAAPVALAGGVVQINLLVGRQIASFYDGAVAWLSYADRLYQLPLGVVGIAVGVVLLPDLSRKLQANDHEGGLYAFNRAAEFALALTIPASAALMLIPTALISVLFERGAFTPVDTANTALAVAVYGLGLPAFVLQKVLQPLFFAREDTRRPLYYAVFAMSFNVVIAVGLSAHIGFIAAAIGTTVTGWLMVFQLWNGARKMSTPIRLDEGLKFRLPRILLATVAMSVILCYFQSTITPELHAEGFEAVNLMICVALGLVSYFGFGQLFGAFSLSSLKGMLRRS